MVDYLHTPKIDSESFYPWKKGNEAQFTELYLNINH